MTWQLGAFSVLAFGLLLGFGWYERARPDARIVALVATLAALAAIGRIAFAALPNVKPTTDIVLISGYALGGAPGFAVGAVTGLTSNFFFGQGPWTPWQMAAWGATGMIGAGLAVVTRRHIGRLPLAAVCGVVGFAFAAVQDVGDWVTFSDHSPAQLGVYVGRGVGFDLIHAVACVAFALAFGPSLTRSIQRFARRLTVRWEAVAAGIVAAVALASFGSGWLAGQPARAAGVARAGYVARAASAAPPGPGHYLLSAQNLDGGFGSAPGQPSSSLYTGWAALGLEAIGRAPQDVHRDGATLLGSIRANVGTDPGSVERTILVAAAAGVSSRSFGGYDLLAMLDRDVHANGSVGGQVNLTSFGLLALRAAGAPAPPKMTGWLIRQQDSDGGFNFATAGGTSDVDDTGAALEALAGAGEFGGRQRAVAFIDRQQDRDGGFPSQPGEGSNAQSTAWAIQGLLAAGADPGALHRRGAPSPYQYLDSLIAADGHVRYSKSSDQTPVWVTGQALLALAGKVLPLAPVHRPAPVHHPARTAVRHTAAAPTTHRKKVNHVKRRGRPGRPSLHSLDGLAAAAACLAALALAPVNA